MKSLGLKTIAGLKFLRGALALGVGLALLDVWRNGTEDATNRFTGIIHLGNQDPVFQLISNWLGSITQEQFLLGAFVALSMCALRWVEGVGIWFNKSWAEVLAILSGCIYIPLEMHVFIQTNSPLAVAILLINCLIVMYLSWVLLKKYRKVR
ncbi:DUF2127 domain-containing protein [Polynucleobacter corsicus]|uniref:DUF2127 domain-containing protein n=1 Tax=Polynucleobacter corsicus TaxID=2081042 RepID=UPI001BFE857C|nr:DUF2127 domain-containing protein [Polynucleobacter corsicus]QWE19200.1 DUF2127 domain-containing protein [Polynucleobacter corsicus]